MEQVLRTHREQALKLLKENRLQSREGIELLVKDRLTAIAAAMQPDHSLTVDQTEALYREVLDLSQIMFSLGFTMAHTVSREPALRR